MGQKEYDAKLVISASQLRAALTEFYGKDPIVDRPNLASYPPKDFINFFSSHFIRQMPFSRIKAKHHALLEEFRDLHLALAVLTIDETAKIYHQDMAIAFGDEHARVREYYHSSHPLYKKSFPGSKRYIASWAVKVRFNEALTDYNNGISPIAINKSAFQKITHYKIIELYIESFLSKMPVPDTTEKDLKLYTEFRDAIIVLSDNSESKDLQKYITVVDKFTAEIIRMASILGIAQASSRTAATCQAKELSERQTPEATASPAAFSISAGQKAHPSVDVGMHKGMPITAGKPIRSPASSTNLSNGSSPHNTPPNTAYSSPSATPKRSTPIQVQAGVRLSNPQTSPSQKESSHSSSTHSSDAEAAPAQSHDALIGNLTSAATAINDKVVKTISIRSEACCIMM